MNDGGDLGALFKAHRGRLMALLLKQFGASAMPAVEDAVQNAMVAALRRWPIDGVPDRPVAWLHTAARRNLIDTWRVARPSIALDERLLAATPTARFDQELSDEELGLLFAICDPTLPIASQIAMALKVWAGLGLRELAAGLLSTEAALAQRLKRARERLAESDLELPGPDALPARRDAVLQALYLLFNEAYQSAAGIEYQRQSLAFEALRLARAVADHPVGGGDAHALAALMCLHAARMNGRVDPDGHALLLDEQLSDRWDRELIALGHRHLQRSMTSNALTRWHIEAGIAEVHTRGAPLRAQDWSEILGWYERLLQIDDGPAVRLAQAISLGHVRGAAAGLAAVESVLSMLPPRYPFGHAARAHFLLQQARRSEAIEALQAAMSAARSDAERRLLQRKLERYRGAEPSRPDEHSMARDQPAHGKCAN